jgi:hypothetical protein
MKGRPANPSQTSLFDISPLPVYGFEESTPYIRWSYSRRNLLEKCPLAYYYHYYGAKLSGVEVSRDQLHFLKSLSNRHLRAGFILHLIIRTYLKKKSDGENPSQSWAMSWADKIWEGDLAFSRGFKNGSPPPEDIPTGTAFLAEFYYREEDAETKCQESREKLARAVETFFSNPSVSYLVADAVMSESEIEPVFYYRTNAFSAEARPDLFFLNLNGRAVIVDWKIGVTGGSEDSLQLIAYALCVAREKSIPADAIDLYLVSLGDGNIEQRNFDATQLFRARARIMQDVSRMQLLDPLGKEGNSKAFTPCEQIRICANCAFREICPAFRQLTNHVFEEVEIDG